MIKYGLIGILLLFWPETIQCSKEQSFELVTNSASIQVTGTSNLHDWNMNLKIFDCTANFILSGSGIKGIDEVTFKCKVTDLKSDNSLMDKKAHSALKSRTFPEINFNMTSAITTSSNTGQFNETLKGNLSVAGKSVAVSIPVICRLYDSNGIKIIDVQGKTELEMSSFDISPPVFMMGALKTGDKVTVSFSLQFKQE
ncbi:MAG: YceI family protein [Bacteroidales bacterium]|nr:YceI family protein [Bacteroidales bacterium]